MTVVEDRIAGFDRGLDALERDDLDGFMAMVEEIAHPDVEFRSAIGSAVGGSVYRGFDGIRAWFTDLLETTDQPRWKDRSYEPLGDDAFLFFARFEMHGAASGIELDTEIGQLLELKAGLVIRGASFSSHGEARAAAEAMHA
jgi:SnoaL-like protein